MCMQRLHDCAAVIGCMMACRRRACCHQDMVRRLWRALLPLDLSGMRLQAEQRLLWSCLEVCTSFLTSTWQAVLTAVAALGPVPLMPRAEERVALGLQQHGMLLPCPGHVALWATRLQRCWRHAGGSLTDQGGAP